MYSSRVLGLGRMTLRVAGTAVSITITEGRCVLSKAEGEETLTVRYTYLI